MQVTASVGVSQCACMHGGKVSGCYELGCHSEGVATILEAEGSVKKPEDPRVTMQLMALLH